MAKPLSYRWSGTNVIDIAQYLGIVIWIEIIRLLEMRMYWVRNKTYSIAPFPQTVARRQFEAISKYFHTFNRRAIPKDYADKLIIVRPVLDFMLDKCCTLCMPRKNLSIDEGVLNTPD